MLKANTQLPTTALLALSATAIKQLTAPQRARQKYYFKNKENIQKQQSEYYLKHRDKLLEKTKAYANARYNILKPKQLERSAIKYAPIKLENEMWRYFRNMFK
jgi:hypothetical protein